MKTAIEGIVTGKFMEKTTLYLAPLRGLTDHVYRNAFQRHFGGFDAAVAPFITAQNAERFKTSQLKDVLPENNRAMPVIPQVLGNDPRDFVSLAVRLFDLGYATVNWNLGCPFPMVAKKERGSGLLPYPQKIEAFLEAALPAMPNRLTVKLRLGRRRADDILRLIPVFNRYPIDEIIVHPRTGIQMYDGLPDLDMFQRCLEMSAIPLVYNGDIDSPTAFSALSRRFEGVTGWMIGRAALADPFLPAGLRRCGPDPATDKVKRFRRFYDELFEEYGRQYCGPGHLLGKMKGFWTYFSRSFQGGRSLEKSIHRSQKLERYRDIVDRFFGESPLWVGADRPGGGRPGVLKDERPASSVQHPTSNVVVKSTEYIVGS